MARKRLGIMEGLIWVSCVLVQLAALLQGQENSTTDGEPFIESIAVIEEGSHRFEVSNRPSYFSIDLPTNGTTKADAIITLSPLGHIDADIFCFPSTSLDLTRVLLDGRRAPWRSNHVHGDDFVFISQHHPRYSDGLVETEDGNIVRVTCAIQSHEARPVSVRVIIDLDYETIEMRQDDEEALESIFTKCCQSEQSCAAWKEHRSNNDSVQSDLCHFHTNVCNTDGHLLRLSLENLNMECKFPYEEITQFKQLKKLLLKGNKFTGNVGRVLNQISKNPNLEHIDIPDSQLTGSLAGSGGMERSGICSLASSVLLHLNLAQNNITGELPGCLLYSRSSVKNINLASNRITGMLPRVSRFSTELEALDLAENQLTGEIPASYAEGTSLEMLDLSRNQLTGIIPSEFGFFPSLISLDLSHNKLSGSFPERLTDVSTLRVLDLSNNELTGELPDSIGDMAILFVLLLGSNKFSGPLPSSLGNLRLLLQLSLSGNNFSGEIPETFRNLYRLGVLSLYNNSLTGSIMNVLPSSLIFLDLRDNQFTGAIPTTVSRVRPGRILSSVRLSNNNFSSFDDEWYRNGVSMWQLGLFSASNNNIKGSFPPRLADAPLLHLLDLSNNDLSGPLPSAMGIFNYLLLLNLSSNTFTGPIPQVWGRSRLFRRNEETTVDLSFNQLSGPLPGFFYEVPMIRRVKKTINLEGNDFEVECPLPRTLSFIQGLVCNPDYSALPSFEEPSLTDIEGDLPKSLFDAPAEGSTEAPEASYITSTINDTMSTERNTSTTAVDGREERDSSNVETKGLMGDPPLEGGSSTSSSNVLWIPCVVVAAFVLLLVAFLVMRRFSNSRKAAVSGGAAGGGRKPVPLISLSTLDSTRALPPQREPSGEDGIQMLTGMQSSAEI